MVTGTTSAGRRRKTILYVWGRRSAVRPMILTTAVQVNPQVRLRGVVVLINRPRSRMRRYVLVVRSFRIGVRSGLVGELSTRLPRHVRGIGANADTPRPQGCLRLSRGLNKRPISSTP